MSVRMQMLQVARLAPRVLGESTELVRGFLAGQQNTDGGFKDRAGRSDLYYTVFGLEGLLALQAHLPEAKVENYLSGFGTGDDLDLVHLCSLARCHAAIDQQSKRLVRQNWASELARQIERFRSADGGYHVIRGSAFGTAYGSFLAFAAYQDLQQRLPDPLRLVQSLKFLETPEGAWANERGINVGATNSTAATVTLLQQLLMPISSSVGDWLSARCHAEGGFVATPFAPLPDLLSTATALHALASLERDLEPFKDKCLDFIDTLWSNEGGFHGHWSDDLLDCEYTYYGLLALGHLSL